MTIKIRQDGLYEIIHPPGSTLTYSFDWNVVIETSTISTNTWDADTGLTLSDISTTDGKTYVTVTGGTNGKLYNLTNTVTYSSTPNNTESRTIVLVCKPKGAY